jgi:hypothetical protein
MDGRPIFYPNYQVIFMRKAGETGDRTEPTSASSVNLVQIERVIVRADGTVLTGDELAHKLVAIDGEVSNEESHVGRLIQAAAVLAPGASGHATIRHKLEVHGINACH